MSDAGEFIDASLQRESTWYRAQDDRERIGGDLEFYGASVGAVRGAVRDAARRYPGVGHDDVTALASELWSAPVFERRLAATVLLQSHVDMLTGFDLTRLEGFVREAHLRALADPLALDVIGPLIEGADARSRARANVALDRWAADPDEWLRRAVLLAPLRALRAGGGDWDGFARRVRVARGRERLDPRDVALEAAEQVIGEMARLRPELRLVAAG